MFQKESAKMPRGNRRSWRKTGRKGQKTEVTTLSPENMTTEVATPSPENIAAEVATLSPENIAAEVATLSPENIAVEDAVLMLENVTLEEVTTELTWEQQQQLLIAKETEEGNKPVSWLTKLKDH